MLLAGCQTFLPTHPTDLQSTMEANQMGSSVYDTDEFRLFCHKILPCSKRTPHDWASCPFAHPGEKAKRRNIRTHQYDCEMCPEVVKGQECKLGSNCPHSHNVFESWLHPQKYRTMMCKDRDKCSRAVCFFAHGPHQLRTPTEVGPPQQQQQQHKQEPAPEASTGLAHACSSSDNALAAMAVDALQGAGMQGWHLMQNLAQLARGTSNASNTSMVSSTLAASGPSTPTAPPLSSASSSAGPAAAFSAAVSSASVSPAAALGMAGCSSTMMYGGHNTSSSSYGNNLMDFMAYEQARSGSSQPAAATAAGGSNQTDLSSMQQLLASLVQQAGRQEAQNMHNTAAHFQQQLQAISAALSDPTPQAATSTAVPVPAAGAACAFMQAGCISLPMQQLPLQLAPQQQQQQQFQAYTGLSAAPAGSNVMTYVVPRSCSFVDCSDASSGSYINLTAHACTDSKSGSISELSVMGLPMQQRTSEQQQQLAQLYAAAAGPGGPQSMAGVQQIASSPGAQAAFTHTDSPIAFGPGGMLCRSASGGVVSVSAAGPCRLGSGSASSSLHRGMSILGSSPGARGQQAVPITLAAAAGGHQLSAAAAGGMQMQQQGNYVVAGQQQQQQQQAQYILLDGLLGVQGGVSAAGTVVSGAPPASPGMYYI